MSYVAVLGAKRKDSKAIKRRRTLKTRMRLGIVSLTSITIALGVILSILYFIQVNKMTLAIYMISDLEEEIGLIAEENERLSSQIAEFTSLDRVEQKAIDELGMVDSGTINYWWDGNPEEPVAKR